MDVVGRAVVYLQAKGQIKIAVIKGSIPADADLAPAHQSRQCFLIECVSKKPHISFGLALPDKLLPEAPEGHVRYGEEISESDSKTVMQFVPVFFLKGKLRRRQEWPSRVIYKVEG